MEHIIGPPDPTHTRQYYQTARPHPWRPTLGYESAEATPLPSQPMTSTMIDSYYTPYAMATEPLKFPNLVTGFERNPAHMSKVALYTRYTPIEWTHNNLRNYNESDTNRNYSERLRGEFIRAMRETDEKTAQGQREAGRRLGERITDLTFWRNEARTELERLLSEADLLQESRRNLEKAITDIEGPLHIAQECLYQRENRIGIDLVHDNPEESLLREVDTYRNDQQRLKSLLAKVKEQLRNLRAAQHELETEVRSKESTLGIDNMCHQLSNFSKGINYYGGIEKFDPTVSTISSWAENSNRIVQRSQAERSRSTQLRSDTENLINTVASEVWNVWSTTNNALARRAAETLEAKNKLQMHLHKVQQEIFDIEKNIELLKKAIMDKSNPMKVAHTRLEARAHRKKVELCRDNAQDRLVREVVDIQDSIEYLHRKLQEAEAQHQQLLRTRSNLESDLHTKVNSLFLDREKCMGMRRSFPITATIKY
ncbi:hypothetical protein Zmor_008233 [Zophobas morio]|uniref:Tektin n=3 Tax=Zophobas morio TaxID=2755281 RepID=A0AA38MQ52_9CUCU|nr:hypothetical protein Zmor_008233 [Zophobas morio]